MTDITVFDTEAEVIERIADDNDLTTAEVIDILINYVDDMKRDYNLR